MTSPTLYIPDRPLGRTVRLGVLVSGGGTTLKNFLAQIQSGTLDAEIALVVASSEDCRGVTIAREAGLPVAAVERGAFPDAAAFSREIFRRLDEAHVDLVTLAGFLKRIEIPEIYLGRVVNIHPALIPSFCGAGFFGHKVHEAVLERGVKISGCTVHFADNEYDHGPIIAQRSVPVLDGDTPDSLAARVFEQECELYPEVVRLYAAGRLRYDGARVRILPTATQPST